MEKKSIFSLSFALMTLWAFGEDEDEECSLENSTASFEVSGSSSFSIVDQPVRVEKQKESVFEGVDETFFFIQGIVDEKVAVYVYIPSSIGTVPPNGKIDYIDLLEGEYPSQAFGSIAIISGGFYKVTSKTTGSLVISKSSKESGSFIISIDLKNLISCRESVDVSGTISFH